MTSLRGTINFITDYIRIKIGLSSPMNLVVFVSGKCNLHCRHCFWWKNKPHEEMTVSQFETLSKTIKKRLNVLHITGGEPMLRNDIAEICAIFAANNHPKNIVISSNCTLPDMVGRCKAIMDRCKEKAGYESSFNVNTSLDGLEKFHDFFRGKGGAFRSTVNSIKALKKAGINVGVCATLTNENTDEIVKISQFTQKVLGVPFAIDLVRGKPRIGSVRPPEFDEKYLDLETPFYPMAQKWHTKVKFDILNGKGKFKCLAGNYNGVIYSNGDLAICELLPPFGNLKETDYNFAKLWKRRPKIPKGCSCTHGINITSSMYYSIRTVIDVLKKNIKIF